MKFLMSFGVAFAVLISTGNAVVGQGSIGETLGEARFQELMKSIVPVENLSQIKWQPDLLVAQKTALEQKKPMFIWSMDGNPLGCT